MNLNKLYDLCRPNKHLYKNMFGFEIEHYKRTYKYCKYLTKNKGLGLNEVSQENLYKINLILEFKEESTQREIKGKLLYILCDELGLNARC